MKIDKSFLLALVLFFAAGSCTNPSSTTSPSSVTETSSSDGSTVKLHVVNATTDTGHYIYRIKVYDNLLNKTIFDESTRLVSAVDTGTRKRDYSLKTDASHKRNNWTVTIYARGGKHGSKSNTRIFQPYSNVSSTLYCCWQGSYISENY